MDTIHKKNTIMIRFILGPELFWLIAYWIAVFLAAKNKSPNHTFDSMIEQSWFWVPVLAFLSFGLFWVQIVETKWLMGRIWLSGLLACHFILELLTEAYSDQGPGIGMTYLVGMIFVFIALLVGSGMISWIGKPTA